MRLYRSKELREDAAEAGSALTLILVVVAMLLGLRALEGPILEETCKTPVAILSVGQTP